MRRNDFVNVKLEAADSIYNATVVANDVEMLARIGSVDINCKRGRVPSQLQMIISA